MTPALRIWNAGAAPDARGHWEKYALANGLEQKPKPVAPTTTREKEQREKEDE